MGDPWDGGSAVCGVAGLVAPGSRTLRDDLERMSARLSHRGPDDHGSWFDAESGIALGHRRLAVVDLSPAGHQPMKSADGRWILVLNGEIYDHEAHRRRLAAKGLTFRGTSDTEVLLALIAERGLESALCAVDGMFALAVWDRRERTLLLARDRVGEKPLYYGRAGQAFAFASELTAIRMLPGVGTAPDPEAVADYLRYGFVPAPLSILPGISKLPAGCIVAVSSSGQAGAPQPYWSLETVATAGLADPLALDETELVDLADRALRTAVGRRLVADVPVGAFLSGGLDSSTIVALAQAVSSRPVHTYTVAVGGEGDESQAAAAVARHLGTDHTELDLADVDPLTLAQQVTSVYDEPFADPSAIPTTLLCASARKHVTVALSGDGADELLAGYNRYRVAEGTLAIMLGLPHGLRAGVSRAIRAIPPAVWDRVGGIARGRLPALGTKVHKVAAALSATDPLGAYQVLAQQWDPSDVLTSAPTLVSAPPPSLVGATSLDRMLLADQQRTLPDNMLVKVDRASMATALEVRVPFLAHDFVELTWRMPAEAKVRHGQGKWLVREILGRYVPRDLWDRPKVGFDPPLADWLRGPLRTWSYDLLSPERLRRQGLLRPEPVAAALAAHHSGRRNMDYAVWTLLMLQSWLDSSEEHLCPR